MFREITEDHLEEAQRTMSFAKNSLPGRGEADCGELIVASAALALERGAPRLMSESYDMKADRYLDYGTRPARTFQAAVARFIEIDANQPKKIPTRGDAVRMIVADVLQQASAIKVVDAIDNPELENRLNPKQMDIVKIARKDPGIEKDMCAIRVGAYHRLSPDMAEGMEDVLLDPLSTELEKQVVMFSDMVNSIEKRDQEKSEAYANDRSSLGKFVEVSPESMAKVVAFQEKGISTGEKSVDDAIKILALSGDKRGFWSLEETMHIAQARLVEESGRHANALSSDLASQALTDHLLMESGRKEMAKHPEKLGSDPEMLAYSKGRYHELKEDRQVDVRSAIAFSDMTPPMERVSFELARLKTEENRKARLGIEAVEPEKIREPIVKRQNEMAAMAMQQQLGR